MNFKPSCFGVGSSLTTSKDTLLILSFLTLFWCLKIGIVFFGKLGELERELADRAPLQFIFKLITCCNVQ